MKVAFFSGKSPVGRRAATLLAENDAVAEVVLAESAAGGSLVGALGPKGVRVEVDPADPGSIAAAVGPADLVVGSLGGETALDEAVATTCIQLGKTYVTALDDSEVCAGLVALASDAGESGALVVAGAGSSPGLSNVLAVHAMEMSSFEADVRISWAAQAAGTQGADPAEQVFSKFTGAAPVFADGILSRLPAGTSAERVWFPEPVGALDAFLCRHSEAVTIPRSFGQVRSVSVKGAFAGLMPSLAMRAASRFGLPPRIAGRTGKAIDGVFPWVLLGTGAPRWSGLRVEVRSSGREAVILGAIDTAANLGGLPLALTALAVGGARPEILRPDAPSSGVVGVEAVLEPVKFLDALASIGVRAARFVPAEGMAA